MLKLNAILIDKNVKCTLNGSKPKIIELVQNKSIPTEEVFILLFIRLREA